MNSIPGRETENWTLSFNQPKETHKKGLLLGTDFRHAVEFSRSGRAQNPAFSGLVRGGFSTLRRPLRESSPRSVTSGAPSRAATLSTTGGSQDSFPRSARLLSVRRLVQPAVRGVCSRLPLRSRRAQ